MIGHDFPAADEIISAAEIAAGFDRLAASLQPLVDANETVLLGIMTGAMFPLVRLAERLTGNFIVDYCHATRYEGGTEGRELVWRETPHAVLAGRTVIIVDDIFDAGLTLQAVAEYCRGIGALRVVTAVMLVKDRDRIAGVPTADFSSGLTVPDRYVFGCGMDLHERWRHLPAVFALRGPAEGPAGEM